MARCTQGKRKYFKKLVLMKKDHQRKNAVEYYFRSGLFFVYPVPVGVRLICFMRTPLIGTQTRFLLKVQK